MPQKSELTGIILAGGNSRRMGVNKAILEVKGKKLMEYPIGLLQKHCARLLISSNMPLSLPYPVVSDVRKGLGPMIGIYSCLLESTTPYNVVLSCDMPCISDEMITCLLDHIDQDKIIVPIHDDDLMEPLCAVYPTVLAEPMKESMEKNRLTLYEFILSRPHTLLNIHNKLKWWSADLFLNVNTPEDLEKL